MYDIRMNDISYQQLGVGKGGLYHPDKTVGFIMRKSQNNEFP